MLNAEDNNAATLPVGGGQVVGVHGTQRFAWHLFLSVLTQWVSKTHSTQVPRLQAFVVVVFVQSMETPPHSLLGPQILPHKSSLSQLMLVRHSEQVPACTLQTVAPLHGEPPTQVPLNVLQTELQLSLERQAASVVQATHFPALQKGLDAVLQSVFCKHSTQELVCKLQVLFILLRVQSWTRDEFKTSHRSSIH